MALTISVDPVPLRVSDNGTVYVGRTRVPLEVVLEEHANGESPEKIVQHYPALNAADVYHVIAYYLQHREEVERYLRQQALAAEKAFAEQEKELPSEKVRTHFSERLRAKGLESEADETS